MHTRSYKPSERLRPYIRRFYVFDAELPDTSIIDDFVLAETGFVRCLLKGDWSGEVAPGEWSQPSRIMLFGSNSTPLKVRVKGGFSLAGFAIRPSGWQCLAYRPHDVFTDSITAMEDMPRMKAAEMLEAVSNASDDRGKIAAMERLILKRVSTVGSPEPDLKMAQFERIARVNSTILVNDAADLIGLSPRQMARRTKACFGLTPKAVLRRSRFLDLATAMRGFSTPSERDLAALRYYDQSHVTREFKRFTNMTPGVFQKTPTPLFTAGLKLRQESLFED